MKKLLLALAATLALASAASAQVVVPASQRFAWDHDGVGVDVFRFCVDGACSDIPGGAAPRSFIPALTPGIHVLAVQACRLPDLCATSDSLTVDFRATPAKPTNFRLEDVPPLPPASMAISQRGTGTRAGFSTGTTVTGTEPAGTVSGDGMLAFVLVEGDRVATLTTPSGWSQLVAPTLTIDAQMTCAVYEAIRGGSAPGLQWTWGGANVYRELIITSWSGIDTSDLVNAIQTAASRNTQTPNTPSITPTVNDAMILSVIFNWSGATTGAGWTAPTNYTLTHTSNSGEDTAVARRLLSGGSGVAEDPGNWSNSFASDDTLEITIALAPAPVGGGGVAGFINLLGVGR